MSKLAWKPWSEVVPIRDDLKSGELTLSMFAADLYDVAMQKGKRLLYEDPVEFFALTYATYNQRELAKDVILRLGGWSEKAVRQLALTYGGGKTHTLITLYHLVNDPAALPDLPAVQEFKEHVGIALPKSRVVTLPFDKLDVEKGMEVRSPLGDCRWLKHPWSVIAYQIAGNIGLRLLNANDQPEERETPPAENLLVDLLSIPRAENLSVLILIDEVLMYAREKVGLDPVWRDRLVDFFQYLTQAVTKVDHCAMVASLLATDPKKSDTLGKEITQELYAIFGRQEEEPIQPVVKEDVAEVLCRRFFKAEAIRDRQAFQAHVVAALKGITELDEQTKKEGKAAEERFLKSYPFHPDLTEVLYQKWTQLEAFQRTRGVLRTFALALRNAAHWDSSPLIGTNVFLSAPNEDGLSDALSELAKVATSEEYEGKRQEWKSILDGELRKAQEIQTQTIGLKEREIEQAVVATFLHSQPIGQKALSRELFLLLGHTRPDRIELEKALISWAEASWFLDEDFLQDVATRDGGQKTLPNQWRLGSKPNLKQMHHDACRYRVSDDYVEQKLGTEIEGLKSLTSGASNVGVKPHTLPKKTKDVDDDGAFHYVLLGPNAASRSGSPSAEAKRYIDEHAGSDDPRVYRNAVICAVPDRDGLEVARQRIRDYLGWEEVKSQLQNQDLDAVRRDRLDDNIKDAKAKVPESIRQAYCIVVTASERDDVQAFKLTIDPSEPLFQQIKNDSRSRIQETAITADALLPEGPYDLWREDEPSRRVKVLVESFAQYPRLPKMLNSKAVLDTLVDGCQTGIFVLQLLRPDGSTRTFWREQPASEVLKDPALEAVLPEAATLTNLLPPLLQPGELPELWQEDTLTLKALRDYFSGSTVVQIQKQGYAEPMVIPKVAAGVIDDAVRNLVQQGRLWLLHGNTSLWREEVPEGALTDDAELRSSPTPFSFTDVLSPNLPNAWSNGDVTTALNLLDALSVKAGVRLPWALVQDALKGAFNAGVLQRSPDSGQWPCDLAGASAVKIQVTQGKPPESVTSSLDSPSFSEQKNATYNNGRTLVTEAELETNEIQNLEEQLDDLQRAATESGLELKFKVRIELIGESRPSEEAIAKLNELLKEVSNGFELK
jgi:hypothetical protein